eukprot:14713535-Alexandrium_andersonii.AAC.1
MLASAGRGRPCALWCACRSWVARATESSTRAAARWARWRLCQVGSLARPARKEAIVAARTGQRAEAGPHPT